jgi:ADP-heptose:LPS heptosyltransferase
VSRHVTRMPPEPLASRTGAPRTRENEPLQSGGATFLKWELKSVGGEDRKKNQTGICLVPVQTRQGKACLWESLRTCRTRSQNTRSAAAKPNGRHASYHSMLQGTEGNAAGELGDSRGERRQFDVGIVLSTVSLSVTSVLLCLLSGAKYRVGYSGRSFGMGFVDGTFHVVVPLVDGTIHQTRLGLRLLEHFGIHTQDLSPVMLPGQDAEKFAEEFVVSQGLQHGAVPLHGAKPPGSTGPVVGIHPGAGKKKNRWPVSGFAYVASALSREFDARILLVGGPADREVLDSLLEILEFRPVLLTGETLDRVAAVMKRLSLFICNDTGVLHVAASVGCPTLSLFGPTDPRRWAPLSERVRTLRAPSLDIATLKEAEVLAAAVEKLSGKGAKGAR